MLLLPGYFHGAGDDSLNGGEVGLHFEKSDPAKSRGELDVTIERSPPCIILSPRFPSDTVIRNLYSDKTRDKCPSLTFPRRMFFRML